MVSQEILDEYNRIIVEGGFKQLDKSVYRIYPNPFKFINDLTVSELENSKNAFLDNFGRCVVLCDQKIAGDTIFIVIENKFEKRFEGHLDNYIKFTKLRMQKTNLKALHAINMSIEGEKIEQSIGSLVLTDKVPDIKEMSDEVYNIFRIENDISIQGIDFDQEMFLNTNWGHIVSYKKGCYLGQEIIARTHNLSKPPKKLVRILFDLVVPDKITFDGKEIGRVTSYCFSPKYGKYIAFALIPSYIEKIDSGSFNVKF